MGEKDSIRLLWFHVMGLRESGVLFYPRNEFKWTDFKAEILIEVYMRRHKHAKG